MEIFPSFRSPISSRINLIIWQRNIRFSYAASRSGHVDVECSKLTMYRVVQKTDTQVYFWDNFGNSAPTTFNHSFTVASRNLWRVRCKGEVFPPMHHTFILWPHYIAKQTLLLISVLSVLFHWLNLSLDSTKIMCDCSSQVAMLDVSTAILDKSFKTSTPFIDTVINETLWEFLPLGDYRSSQFFHRLES